MPNRIIKESICYSDDIDKLTPFEETVFYRLLVNCDDYGRIDARPGFLKSKLYATKQGITEKNVNDAVSKLASIGLVKFYEVDKKLFLLFPKWSLHQRVRNSKEKYPAPQDNYICGELPQLAANCGLNPIQSNPIPNQSESLSESKSAERMKDYFETFWNAYPKKQGKGAAEKAFSKYKVDSNMLSVMVIAIENQAKTKQWKENEGQYIPYPATWLNQRRWEDENTVIYNKKGSFKTDEIERLFIKPEANDDD